MLFKTADKIRKESINSDGQQFYQYQQNEQPHHTLINKGNNIRVITKLPNTEQSSKGKVKTHKSINRQNQSTTGKLGNRNGPHLVQAFLNQ